MKEVLLKFIVVLVICFAVHILVSFFSGLIVNKFILNTHLANFTVYDGYADFSVFLTYILVSASLVFDKLRDNVFVIAIGSLLTFLTAKVFIIDTATNYLRFYVKTNQNGAYSFEI